jgi:hypothetical protein
MKAQLVCLVIGMCWSEAALAQGAPADIPLTYDAFRGLTAQQAARRLIGPSAELVAKMTIIGPPLVASLSVVSFSSTPRASDQPGLCQRNEIDVSFEAADGSPAGSARSSTLMRISGVTARYGYRVVGALNARLSERPNIDVASTCAGLDLPHGFFSARSSRQAWEAAYLVDLAIKAARVGDPQSVKCSARNCNDVQAALSRLSPSEIYDVASSCNRPGSDACYSVLLDDPSDSFRAWSVDVEAARAREPTLRNFTFTLFAQPRF